MRLERGPLRLRRLRRRCARTHRSRARAAGAGHGAARRVGRRVLHFHADATAATAAAAALCALLLFSYTLGRSGRAHKGGATGGRGAEGPGAGAGGLGIRFWRELLWWLAVALPERGGRCGRRDAVRQRQVEVRARAGRRAARTRALLR